MFVSNLSFTLQNYVPIDQISVVDTLEVRKHVDPRDVTLCDDEFLDMFNLNFDKFSTSEVDAIKEVLLKRKTLFAINDHQLGCLKDVNNNNNNLIRVLLFQDCSSTNLCKNKNKYLN